MPKPIDPKLRDLLQKYGEPASSVWDCHGTWVAYHAAIERMAAMAGIAFDPPVPLVADAANKHVALVVTARVGERSEWSIGEASPANNKNAYPFAMAEKRAKDRVALKLLGMSGLVYSEDEADDFKETKPSSAALKREGAWEKVVAQVTNDFIDVQSVVALDKLWGEMTRDPDVKSWPVAWKHALKDMFAAKREELTAVAFPGDTPAGNGEFHTHESRT